MILGAVIGYTYCDSGHKQVVINSVENFIEVLSGGYYCLSQITIGTTCPEKIREIAPSPTNKRQCIIFETMNAV